MHYRNGREAKNGDKIVSLGFNGSGVVAFGVLYDAVPGNDFCNGNIAPVQAAKEGACLCDCLHVDDLAAILADRGLDKRSVGLVKAWAKAESGEWGFVEVAPNATLDAGFRLEADLTPEELAEIIVEKRSAEK